MPFTKKGDKRPLSERIKQSETRKSRGLMPPSRKGAPPNSGSFYKGIKFSEEFIEKREKNRLRGEKHPCWKGGITPENIRIRNSPEGILWRNAVFQRDHYTCVWCGDSRGGNLEADHIKPFAQYPELRFAIDNGRTLCHDCHTKTSTYGKKY